jgi:hypothetical protein
MMLDSILAREAGVYREIPDALGVSFTTAELFHGSIGECLRMIGTCSAAQRDALHIETVDGMVHLDAAEIEEALRQIEAGETPRLRS